MEAKYQKHQFQPIYNEKSRILILGTFPSVKSREQRFYYGHPQNRFWKVLAALCECRVPENIDEKKQMLLENGIAIWDVIDSCTIAGSSDSSIKDVVANDVAGLLAKTQIEAVFANGKMAEKLYLKYIGQDVKPVIALPSTSPANAAYSLQRLVECWKPIMKHIEK